MPTLSDLLTCPDCQNWQRRVNEAQSERDPEKARVLYSLWMGHIADQHEQPLYRQLWPGAILARGE
jgi:hypothetical protein